ncbi:hypothetical protein [Paracoccus tegillarcae]|uniref:Uncharacterized protein n=1 Tax=Paracoccus tegillarcae TaxID=1529068 RepID=A0A2K9EUW2_9RHOB|nr:hypothetical protein [Paracoccus tegillarcae]AUH34656.1 hypothetical protein CUV01_15845 [Paracoccus tegillarcae]
MQSYAAARSLFSFLTFIAWCTIIGGALIFIMAIAFLSQFNSSFPAMISAAIPGIGICLFGFLALVMVQIGRASVDSAEFGQQSLQVARDQLAFAKQVHHGAVSEPTTTQAASPSSSAPSQHQNGSVTYYSTVIAANTDGTYLAKDKTFPTLEAAKKHVDEQPVWSR